MKQSFIKVRKGQRKLLTQTQKGRRAPSHLFFFFLNLVLFPLFRETGLKRYLLFSHV